MSDATERSVFEPVVSELSEPFWDATRRHELVLPWCVSCEEPIWFPREVCPRCGGTDIDWRVAGGSGEVYAVSVHHKPGFGRNPAEGPYAVALVELDEGVRLMSDVVGCAPDDVAVGMPVSLTWRPMSDGRNLPQFTVTDDRGGSHAAR